MPRDSQGNYTLPPAYNPVIPGTLIEAAWANTTLDDVAEALTGSLPTDGSAPMIGPLTLSAGLPTAPRHATSKQYVDNFVAFSTGLPVGAVIALATASVPGGFLLCNGQAVSRTTYSVLFGAIGTTYGSGDGATTFNVPDARDYFIRGRGVGRLLGSLQSSAFGAHIHPISDLGHTHIATQLSHAHSLTTGTHTHGITDPGHAHGIAIGGGSANPNTFPGNQNNSIVAGIYTSQSNTTGISIQSAAALTGNTDTQNPAITVQSATTGVVVGSSGDTETRPQNIAFDYYIKALQDTAGPVAILNITSADNNLIDIDFTVPTAPQLVPKSNIAFGMVKLDAGAKVPLAQMPFTATSLLGYFDASGGNNPSQEFPAMVFINGNQYIVSVEGTIPIRDPVTGIESPTLVTVGTFLTYIKGSATSPDGWYGAPAPATLPATSISFIPSGPITATNVQDAIDEVKAEAGDMFKANNLSDLTNIPTARTNLGLGSAAQNNTGDFATAAQGAKADTALQPSAINTTVQGYDPDLITLGAGGAPARSFLGLAIGTDVQGYDANTAKLNVEQTWTAQQTPKNGSLTDGANIDWNGSVNGQVVAVTLAGNRVMNAPTNIKQYASYVLRITQDATGNRTLTWNTAFKFGGQGAPVLTTTGGKVDILGFIGGASNTLEYTGIRKDAV